MTGELMQTMGDLGVLTCPISQWGSGSPEAALSNHFVNFVPYWVPRETLCLPAARNSIESNYNLNTIYNIVQYSIRNTFEWTRGKVNWLSKNE